MVDLSVIIVSYNNKQVITDCLNSIERFNDIGDQLQVIVVEQSPTTDIFDYISREYSWVNTIRHENKGFGSGNNAGAKLAEAPYLLFLNPDTILLEPIFKFAIEMFQRDSTLGMFGVKLLDANHKKNSSFMMRIPYGFRNKAIYNLYHRIDYFDSRLMYIQGADMFVRSNVFKRIEGFDESIFMYCEESDLCLRIEETGYTIKYNPAKKIIHLEGKTTKGDYDSILEKQILSFQYLCKKHDLPFKIIISDEYNWQKLKLFACKVFRRNGLDAQAKIVKLLEKYV